MQCAHVPNGHCGKCARTFKSMAPTKTHKPTRIERRQPLMQIEAEDARSIAMSGLRLNSRRFGRTLAN